MIRALLLLLLLLTSRSCCWFARTFSFFFPQARYEQWARVDAELSCETVDLLDFFATNAPEPFRDRGTLEASVLLLLTCSDGLAFSFLCTSDMQGRVAIMLNFLLVKATSPEFAALASSEYAVVGFLPVQQRFFGLFAERASSCVLIFHLLSLQDD